MKLLNLGCGGRFHPDWVNLDLHPALPSIRKWDLQKELPFPDASFDVVYHSHVLEHFSRADGATLLKQCHRVLRPGGILRLAVPDLERIVRLYLEALDKSLGGDAAWQRRYEWILLEMYDQSVRESYGGEMRTYMRRDPIPERDFVESRIGGEFERIIRTGTENKPAKTARTSHSVRNWVSRKVARLVLGREGIAAYDAGIFRYSGELHRWMYDRYSLASALKLAGFVNAKQMGPAESGISGWVSFHLDTQPNSETYKPDSLFMEAKRP
jgi:predicted SAM-dependent methyltransferase